jgi:hypothetical protein
VVQQKATGAPSRRSVLGMIVSALGSAFISVSPARLFAGEWGEDEQLVLHQGWVLRSGDIGRMSRS